ncbi:MAG TPA: hypothetical protein VHT03_15500 [Rhizomicrobium sp.]|jgi:hypothetical protein|nr:hypothetical protein [Rhizomicrobium sp.]
MSTLRKFQILLFLAVIAAPLGLIAARMVTVLFWSWVVGFAGLVISIVSVAAMALTRCPRCHALLGLGEAAREFHSHCCPSCGMDLRKRM